MKDKHLYIEEYKMLFELEDNQEYYPLLYDCVRVDGEYEGKVIKPNSILGYWTMWVKWSFREDSKIDGASKQGNLRLFQWKLSIDLIQDIMEMNNARWAVLACRQSGKSRLLKSIGAFCLGFSNLVLDLPKFQVIMLSYNDKSIQKIFPELKLEIYKVIEFFNLLFPDRKLIIGREAKQLNLADNAEKLEIGLLYNGKELTYSEVYAFSGTVVRDGYSANLILSDESQFLDYEFVNLSITPFLANTSGSMICTGICTADSKSLMYKYYFDDNVEKFIHDWKNHVKILAITDEKKAKDYETYALNYIRENGEHSTNTASNMTMRMDNLIDGKLINMDILINNNIMRGNIEEILIPKKDVYVGIGLDIGMGGSGDRTVAIVSENRLVDGQFFIHDIKNIVPFTYEKNENLDTSILYEKTKQLCVNTHADFILCDGTGLSKLIVSGLNDYLKEEGIPTQVISFDFSGSKKSMMYQYGENAIYSQRLILPENELTHQHKGWALLLRELLMLLKYKKGSNTYYTYEAPKGEHDDSIASLMLSLFSCAFILQMDMENKEITLGRYTFIPRLQKANWSPVIEEHKERVTNWLFR